MLDLQTWMLAAYGSQAGVRDRGPDLDDFSLVFTEMLPLRGVRSLGGKRGILRLIVGLANLMALTTLTVLGIGPTPQWFHLRKHQW